MKHLICLVTLFCLGTNMRAVEINVPAAWLKHGHLICVPSNIARSGCGTYFYIVDNDEAVVLNGSIHGFELMMHRQAFSNEQISSFIEHQLHALLVTFFGDGSVVSRDLVAEYKKYVNNPSLSELVQGRVNESIVKKIADQSEKASLQWAGSEWKLCFRVVTQCGSIEEWSVRGVGAPFAIKAIGREVLFGAGTIPVLPTY